MVRLHSMAFLKSSATARVRSKSLVSYSNIGSKQGTFDVHKQMKELEAEDKAKNNKQCLLRWINKGTPRVGLLPKKRVKRITSNDQET